jgi:F0F1-type ATP synthase membrane subunit a
MAAMYLEMLGLVASDVSAFSATTSMMMVHAFGIAAVMPAEGKTEAVKEGLQNFINLKQQAFEFYLPDQYDNAKNAKLEVLADGTVLMVMCAGQDEVFNGIKTAIEGAY